MKKKMTLLSLVLTASMAGASLLEAASAASYRVTEKLPLAGDGG